MSLLSDEDEEFQMLLEVAEEYARQKKEKTPQSRSGKATEIVVRNHLLRRGFNLTQNPNVKIQGSGIKNDLLLLKPNVNPNKPIYPPNEVSIVLEIKNNAVGNQSKRIRWNFDELSKISGSLCFAAVVLSERKGYTHQITEEKLGNKRYRVFTLVSRKIYPNGGLYLREAIMRMHRNHQMTKTGDWERLVNYLSK